MQARLFISNLSWSTTAADLSDPIAGQAAVLDAKMISDRDTGRSRGFACVTIERDRVQEVVRALDDQDVHGRAIRVNEAEEKPQRDRGSFGGARRQRS